MDKEYLDKIVKNYISKFDVINNKTNEEYYKWEAVKHFQEHWDIDARDFASMFKEAVKETSTLINNRIVQPTNGIVKLAERPELTEVVRQMFKDLLADDHGDIDKRQEKIHVFLDKADELLNTYEKGKWKYAQDMRTVITYLNLVEPSKNYLFKATEAKEFSLHTRYSDDIGSGSNFSLKKYYNMCDELVEKIKDSAELTNLHNCRITEKMWAYDNYHILAYDIIYCALRHNLYNDIPRPEHSKSMSYEQRVQARREERAKEIKQLELELNEAIFERAQYDNFSAKGLEVENRFNGKGVVVDHNESKLRVQFSSKKVEYQMPQSVSDGFLKIESEEIMDIFKTIDSLNKKIASLENMIKYHNTKQSSDN